MALLGASRGSLLAVERIAPAVRRRDAPSRLHSGRRRYLSSAEPEAKQHMERAVMMVLGFSRAEKDAVLRQRATAEAAASSALAAWFSATPAPAP